MRRRFLVTGGTGFIGRRVCRLLLERGLPLTILENQPDPVVLQQLQARSYARGLAEPAVTVADISDLSQTLKAFGQYDDIGYVIHLAYLMTSAVEEDPVRGAAVNVVGTASVLEASVRNGVRRFVLASSEAVYGRRQSAYDGRAVCEEDYCSPRDHFFVYGPMKLLSEFMARKYAEKHGISVACLRPSIVFGYGRGSGAQQWAESFASNPAVNEPARLPFPASNCDNWIYVDDCAEQLVRLALKPNLEHFAYNSGGETVTAAELVRQVKRYLPNAEIDFDSTVPGTPLIDELDGGRLAEEIDFQPRPLAAGLFAHICEAREAAGLPPLTETPNSRHPKGDLP